MQNSVYTFSYRDEETKVFISDVYSYGIRISDLEQPVKKLPYIGVGHTSSNQYHIGLNQLQERLYDDNGKLIGELWAGGWEGTFQIQIAAESTIEREELADLSSMYLIYIKREQLRENGVLIRNMSIGGESEEPYGSDYIYLTTLTLDIWTEWWEQILFENIDEIEKIGFRFGLKPVAPIQEDDYSRTPDQFIMEDGEDNVRGSHIGI